MLNIFLCFILKTHNIWLNCKTDLNSTISNIGEFGYWTPTFSHYSATDTTAQYYKIGKLVYISIATLGNGDGSSSDVTISLPFKPISIRNYGVVGYFPNSANLPNLHTVCSAGNQLFAFEYGSGGSISSIKGNQLAGPFQCNIVYVCE